MIQKAQKECKTVHFATLIDFWHLKKRRVGQEVLKMPRTCCTSWSCWKKFVRGSSAGLVTIWKRSWWTMGGQNSKLGMFAHAPRKGLVFLYLCWRHNNEREEEQSETHAGQIDKQVDLEELTTMLHQEYMGCTQRECKPNLKIVREIRRSNLWSQHVISSNYLVRTIPTRSNAW